MTHAVGHNDVFFIWRTICQWLRCVYMCTCLFVTIFVCMCICVCACVHVCMGGRHGRCYLNTVWPEILAGNIFWRIGGSEINPPIVHPPKNFTV